MGYFYTGFDYKNRKNGYFKIGETGQKYLSSRISNIQHYDSFQCLGYIELIGETRSERLFVESYVRMKMEKVEGLTHTQNDHFLYAITSKEEKYSQAQTLAKMALEYAIEICDFAKIEYKIGTNLPKRK